MDKWSLGNLIGRGPAPEECVIGFESSVASFLMPLYKHSCQKKPPRQVSASADRFCPVILSPLFGFSSRRLAGLPQRKPAPSPPTSPTLLSRLHPGPITVSSSLPHSALGLQYHFHATYLLSRDHIPFHVTAKEETLSLLALLDQQFVA